MRIAQLRIEDIEIWQADIEELIRETIKYNFSDNYPPESYYLETIDEVKNYLRKGQALVFAMFEEKKLLGWIWCHDIQRFNEKRLHVANFAVKPCVRKLGIGNKLLSAAESYAKEHSYDGLDLLVTSANVSAVSFYENHGLKTERLLMKKDFKNDY